MTRPDYNKIVRTAWESFDIDQHEQLAKGSNTEKAAKKMQALQEKLRKRQIHHQQLLLSASVAAAGLRMNRTI